MACGIDYDVGCDCVARATTYAVASTYVNNDNPASAGGTTDFIYNYCCSNLSGLEYGAFEDLGSNSLTCRGNCSGAGLTATADQCTTHEAGVDFTAFSFGSGEYIGMHATGG